MRTFLRWNFAECLQYFKVEKINKLVSEKNDFKNNWSQFYATKNSGTTSSSRIGMVIRKTEYFRYVAVLQSWNYNMGNFSLTFDQVPCSPLFHALIHLYSSPKRNSQYLLYFRRGAWWEKWEEKDTKWGFSSHDFHF